MRTTIVVTSLLIACNLAFGQATVFFNNRFGGTNHVYGPSPSNPTLSLTGNASNDIPPGPGNKYTSAGMMLIGSTLTGQYGAQSTLAQLLGAPGSNAPEQSLLSAVTPAVSFRTGVSAGYVASSTATFNNIAPDAPVASFEMVAWDNSTGLYPTWSLASTAWLSGVIAAGKSPEFNLYNIGGAINTPPFLFPGLESFNIYFIPEPMTASLACLGAFAFMISRRRK
jgi:hypothetical protein